MPSGVLLDTSVWIRYFRPGGDGALKEEVARLLQAGRVWMVPPVRTELLVGARDEGAFKRLAELLDGLPEAPLDDQAWQEAAWSGFQARKRGYTVPLADLLIAQAALKGGLELWHADAHYELLASFLPLKTRPFLSG